MNGDPGAQHDQFTSTGSRRDLVKSLGAEAIAVGQGLALTLGVVRAQQADRLGLSDDRRSTVGDGAPKRGHARRLRT